MLNRHRILYNITKWIRSTLSVEYPEFNGMRACPFAGKALDDRKIIIKTSKLRPDIDLELLKHKEVVIYVFEPETVTSDELYNMAQSVNSQYPDLVALEDHPDDLERVGSVVLNQGKYALLLIQHRDKLEQARKFLESKGYYENWSDEYKNDVLNR